jgi:ribose transport system substrate-binding protein
LIDATKFGKPQRAIFAEPAQISRIFSDGSLDPRWIDALEQMGVPVTICDDRKAFATNPQAERGEAHERYRIGFANLGAQVPFALEVQQGLEQAAAHVSNIIDLVMADNQLSASIALEVAGSLIASNVDLAIEFQIDQQANEIIMARFRDAGIPVIAVDIPMHGATFFGVDNYRSGHMAGVAIGRWVAEHWDAQCDRVILMEEPRAGQTPAGRLRGQLEGLQSVVGQIPHAKVIHLDCSNVADVARVRVGNLLPELPGRHLAFLSINDDVALGALQAIRDAGREEDVVAVGQGATRHGRAEIRRPGTRLIGATAFRPETYGPQLLDIAINILRHQPVPPAVYIDHVFITAENVDEYYPDD